MLLIFAQLTDGRILCRSEPAPGWREYVHLNGAVYYYYRERHILTAHDVSKPGVSDRILKSVNPYFRDGSWDRNLEFVAYDFDNPSGPFFDLVNLHEGSKWRLNEARTGECLAIYSR